MATIPNKLLPWYMAQARHCLVTVSTVGIVWWGTFWQMWQDVMYPPANKG